MKEEAREQIKNISSNLSDVSKGSKRPIEYERESTRLLNNSDVSWVFNSGKRIICGISRTINGYKVTDKFTPCVVKFETHVEDWNPSRNNNQKEINVWRNAVESEDTHLFGTILDYDENGKWLVMKKYIPVFGSQFQDLNGIELLDVIDEYLIKDNKEDFISDMKSRLEKKGWYARDLKGGNIGYDPIDDEYVLIDYGSSIKYDS